MKETEEEIILQSHNIRPTSVRILVYRTIRHRTETFTLNDVEGWLPVMDRSSIFRALKLFTEHKLIHEIDDGSGFCKYCVCRCDIHSKHNDEDHNPHHINHIHFACTKCGKTYCIEDQAIPAVTLPEGFITDDIEYIVKGTCRNCSQKCNI